MRRQQSGSGHDNRRSAKANGGSSNTPRPTASDVEIPTPNGRARPKMKGGGQSTLGHLRSGHEVSRSGAGGNRWPPIPSSDFSRLRPAAFPRHRPRPDALHDRPGLPGLMPLTLTLHLPGDDNDTTRNGNDTSQHHLHPRHHQLPSHGHSERPSNHPERPHQRPPTDPP